MRKADIDALLGGAAVDVGNEHGREVGGALLNNWGSLDLNRTLGRAAGDRDGSAVHIHFAVTDAIEPGPSECVLARLDAFRNGEAELVRIFHACTSRQVSIHVGRASTFKRLDDFPLRLFRRFPISSQTDLTRTAAVGGAAFEGQGVGRADGNGVLLRDIKCARAKLARKVAAIRSQGRIVEGVLAIRDRVGHDHMSVNRRGTQCGNQNRLREHHGDELDGNEVFGARQIFISANPIRTRRFGSDRKGLDLVVTQVGEEGFLRRRVSKPGGRGKHDHWRVGDGVG